MSDLDLPTQKRDPYAVLRIRDFRYFISARVFGSMAIKMQGVIVGWQIYSLTKDPLALGMIGLAEAIPAIGVALYAGYLADKVNRKYIVTAVYSMLILCTTGLLVLSAGVIEMPLSFTIRAMYAVIFVTGLARGFLSPSLFGLLSQCVPRELYPNSSAWNTSLNQVSVVIGAAAGGLIFAAAGFSITYLINIFLLLAALMLIACISPKPKPVLVEGHALLDNLLSGIRFVFRHQILLSVLSLDLFAVLFGGAVALLPIFADHILHIGPQGLGLLRAAPSAGAFLMAVVLIYKPPLRNTGRKLLWCVAGFGVCMIFFALSRNFYLSLFLLMLSGMFDNVSVVIRSIIMQTFTPDEMKGRVSSVNSMFIGSSNEIGAFESGVSARFFGTIPSVVIGGGITLAVVALATIKAPLLRVMSLDKHNAR